MCDERRRRERAAVGADRSALKTSERRGTTVSERESEGLAAGGGRKAPEIARRLAEIYTRHDQ